MCVCVWTHPGGVGLYGQSRIDREHFEEEGQLALEGVFHLGAQAGGEVGDPLAQRGLRDPVVLDLGVAFRVGAHPQLEEKTTSFSGFTEAFEGRLEITEVCFPLLEKN